MQSGKEVTGYIQKATINAKKPIQKNPASAGSLIKTYFAFLNLSPISAKINQNDTRFFAANRFLTGNFLSISAFPFWRGIFRPENPPKFIMSLKAIMIGMVMEVKPVSILRWLIPSNMKAYNVLAIFPNDVEDFF